MTKERLIKWYDSGAENREEFISLIEAALVQQEKPAQEPVAYELVAVKFANGKQLVYAKPENLASYITARPLVYAEPATHPAKPLSDEEVLEIARKWSNRRYVESNERFLLDFAREVIEAHIKGGAQK